MTALTYFRASLHYLAISADEPNDPGPIEAIEDIEPQTKGINGTCNITAHIKYPPSAEDKSVKADCIQASALTPYSAMLALAPIRARIDNGVLMLRAEPDRPSTTYANLAAFPAAGSISTLYRAGDTQLLYAWNGSSYVLTDDFAPVRLVAQTSVLGLPTDAVLCYRFSFENVTYGGGEQKLTGFTVAAPTADVVLDLATAPRTTL